VLATALLCNCAATDIDLRALRHEAQLGRLQHDFIRGGEHDALGGGQFDVVRVGLQFELAARGDEFESPRRITLRIAYPFFFGVSPLSL
jgi:hypothetical protein